MKNLGVIFDMDGTIILSESEKAYSHCEVIKKFNPNNTITPEIYKHCIGNSFEFVRDYFLNHAKVSIPKKEYKTEYHSIYLNRLNRIKKPIANFREFLLDLKIKNIKTGLVTSSNKEMVTIVLNNLNLQDQFDVVITKDDVSREKPHPEPYQLAHKKLNTKTVIVFEDTYAGFVSASNITQNIFAIRHDFNEFQNFKLAKQVFNSYEGLNIKTLDINENNYCNS